ncbi:MAG: hypothetical protein AB7U75_14895 [Hyphomicrobiaceae bacterium]
MKSFDQIANDVLGQRPYAYSIKFYLGYLVFEMLKRITHLYGHKAANEVAVFIKNRIQDWEEFGDSGYEVLAQPRHIEELKSADSGNS